MEWLLILSALLSAVTGAISGGRAPEGEVQRTEAAAAGVQVLAAAVQPQAVRARAPLPRHVSFSTEVAPLPDFALAAPVPAFADRRRE